MQSDKIHFIVHISCTTEMSQTLFDWRAYLKSEFGYTDEDLESLEDGMAAPEWEAAAEEGKKAPEGEAAASEGGEPEGL